MSVKLDKIQLHLIIDGKEAATNVNQVRDALKVANAELNRMNFGSAEYNAQLSKVQNLKSVLTEHNNSLKGVAGSWNQVNKEASGFSKLMTGIGPAVIAAFGVHQVISFGEECVKAFNEAAQGEAKLLNALGGQKGVQEDLIKQAKELQKITIYSDDQIIKAQAFLAAQGHTEEQIKKTIKAAIQLAAVTGIDLQTATQQLSGTYEGVTGKMGNLDSRIKDFTKTQLANGAVIDLINDKYQGFAETAAKTGTGPLEVLKNQFNDLQEKIGQGLLSGITGLAAGLSTILDDIMPLIEAIGDFSRALGAGSSNVSIFKTWLDVMYAPIKPLIVGFTQLAKDFKAMVPTLAGLGAAFMAFFHNLADTAAGVFGGIGDMIAGVFSRDPGQIAAGFAQTKAAFSKAGADIGEAFSRAYEAKLFAMNIAENKAHNASLEAEKEHNEKMIKEAKKHQNENFKVVTDTSGLVSESSQEHYEREEKLAADLEKLRNDIYVGTLTDNQREQVAIMQKYDNLVEQGEKYGLDITGLRKMEEAELAALQKKTDDAEIAENEKKNKKLKKDDQQMYEAKKQLVYAYGNVVQNGLDLLGAATGDQLEFQKAAALVQVAISTGVAISDAVQGAMKIAGGNPYVYAAIIATDIAAILASISTALGYFRSKEIPKYAEGEKITYPHMAMVGEDAPTYPEFAISTNPKYRARSLGLLQDVSNMLQPFKFTPQPVINTSYVTNAAQSPQNSMDMQLMKMMMQEMIITQRELRDEIKKGLNARLNYDQFNRDIKTIDTAKNGAKLTN